ncbi:MAG: thermonuclease family protein [Myxococcales bacterium]|nr:thermonuclease family protein [Myxococcales bacterium]
MSITTRTTGLLLVLVGLGVGLGTGVGCEPAELDCGPTEAVVERVIDGDTVQLATGERVRYLLIDTPEVSEPVECYGPEATDFNRTMVEGQTVQLTYDEECTDRYGRLLAYVEVDGRSVNELLLSRGFACVLHIPPNGADRVDEYRRLEEKAQVGQVGLWGACPEDACD